MWFTCVSSKIRVYHMLACLSCVCILKIACTSSNLVRQLHAYPSSFMCLSYTISQTETILNCFNFELHAHKLTCVHNSPRGPPLISNFWHIWHKSQEIFFWLTSCFLSRSEMFAYIQGLVCVSGCHAFYIKIVLLGLRTYQFSLHSYLFAEVHIFSLRLKRDGMHLLRFTCVWSYSMIKCIT